MKCATCNIEFYVKKSHINRRKFCSKICMNKKVHTWCTKNRIIIKKLDSKQKLEELKKSFEKNVIKNDGCWDWKGAKDKDGYARMSCSPLLGAERAHMASYLIHIGKIPKGKLICHHCDVKVCTNPKCLFVAYPRYNSADMVIKNRQAKGSKNGTSKLSENQVKEIKKMLHLGNTGPEIAKKYSVHYTTIYRIRDEKNWSHVTLDPEPES